MLVGLVVSVLVARYLGPDAMGEWSFAISFVTFFSALAYLGFNSILPREFINDGSTEKIISTAMISRGLASLIALLASVLVMAAWKGWQSDYIIYVLILSSVFIFGVIDVFDYYFQSKLQSKNR